VPCAAHVRNLTLENIPPPFDKLNTKKEEEPCNNFCMVLKLFAKQYKKYDKSFVY
jgi:hypothetical protein